MRAQFSEVLRLLGLRPSPTAHDDKTIDEEVRLYLRSAGEGIFVGRLRKEGDEFVFEYSKEFASREDLPSLPDFPHRNRPYRSADLWPFFLVRLPPSDRPDVQRVIRDKGIEPQNTLELLGKLGRRAISSPYELELTHT